MRDGCLKSMVAQFKRSRSRSSAIASGLHSRPASSLSQIAPMNGFTPIHPVSQETNSSFDQTCSERSTPSIYSQTRSSSVLPTITNRVLIAKCQSCNIKGELIVCNHCDNVICTRTSFINCEISSICIVSSRRNVRVIFEQDQNVLMNIRA